MANSYVDYIGDGSTTIFNLTFGYLDKSHVKVFVDGVDTVYTWNNDASVAVSPAPAIDAIVRVQRDTPKNPVIDFNDGESLTEQDLDTVNLQALYLSQEAEDSLGDVLQTTVAGKYDAQNRVIENLQDPTNPQDAASKAYVDAQFADDVAAVDADRVAAQAARDAALAAQATSETARDASQAAQALSEAARNASQAAQAAAETAEGGAQAAQAAAAVSATASENSRIAAEAAETAAAASALTASTSASNASGSESAAAASASAAAASESAAAASAAAAATSESNAATSEANAAASAAAAATFDPANFVAKAGSTMTGNLEIEGGGPMVILDETDGTSTHRAAALVVAGDNFAIQTRDGAGAWVSTDYLIERGASGATKHTFRISGAEKFKIDGNAPHYTARAAAHYNTSGGSTIGTAYNVSSLTDMGIGKTQLNFATAMANNSYVAVTSSNGKGQAAVVARASGWVEIWTYDAGGGLIDCSIVTVAVYQQG